MEAQDIPKEWWRHHHKHCGTLYRGCHPLLCPKNIYEETGEWIGGNETNMETITITKKSFNDLFDMCRKELELTKFRADCPDPKYAENKQAVEEFANNMHRSFNYHVVNLQRKLEKA